MGSAGNGVPDAGVRRPGSSHLPTTRPAGVRARLHSRVRPGVGGGGRARAQGRGSTFPRSMRLELGRRKRRVPLRTGARPRRSGASESRFGSGTGTLCHPVLPETQAPPELSALARAELGTEPWRTRQNRVRFPPPAGGANVGKVAAAQLRDARLSGSRYRRAFPGRPRQHAPSTPCAPRGLRFEKRLDVRHHAGPAQLGYSVARPPGAGARQVPGPQK